MFYGVKHPNGRMNVKNLTVGKEYSVLEAHSCNTEYVGQTCHRIDIPAKVRNIYVLNDKDTKYSYSIKHFELPTGIVSDLREVEQDTVRAFQDELRSL